MDTLAIGINVIFIRSLFILFPILAGIGHCLWKKNTPGFSKIECFLVYFLTITSGLQSLVVGYLELYQPEAVAAYLGWHNSPFLPVLAKGNIAFGVLGVLSFWFRGAWRSAAALGYSLFLLMTSTGIYGDYLHTLHPEKSMLGLVAFTDLMIAGCLLTLLILRRFSRVHQM